MKQRAMSVVLAITLAMLNGCAFIGCGAGATNGAALGGCHVGTSF